MKTLYVTAGKTLYKVQMDVLSFNATVHRLMAKIGAHADATFREHFFIAGRFWDVVSYSLTRDEWHDVGASYRRLYRGPAPWDLPPDP